MIRRKAHDRLLLRLVRLSLYAKENNNGTMDNKSRSAKKHPD